MPVIFLFFALICFSIHWLFRRKNGLQLLLLYLVFFCFGINGIADFIGHIFYADEVAELIKCPIGSRFQFLVGIANLSFGILAILSVWLKNRFLLAALIGNSIWLWGQAIEHSIGLYFWADIFVPILIWGIYFLNKKSVNNL